MKTLYLSLGISLALSALLVACGGGGNGNVNGVGGPPGGGPGTGTGTGGANGTLQGDISSIVGNYTVTVSLADCDPADNDETTTFLRTGDGGCSISSTTASGTVVLTQRDLLPAGSYRLTIANDGSVSIGAITRACTGTCIVSNSTYTLTDAVQSGAGANISLSQIILNTANPRTAVGYIYATGLQVSGATLATGESGVIVFE